MKLLRDQILKIIDINKLSLIDTLELLANVMIAVAFKNISTNPTYNTWQQAWLLIQDDIKANGETLSNAAGRQAMLIISWIEIERNKVDSKDINIKDQILEERRWKDT